MARQIAPTSPTNISSSATDVAPSKKFSVRAHGNGELGDDDFHLYLMAEPGAKKIGPLEEVDDTLDTAPDSYNAKWSADSRHVGLFYRSERHVVSMRLYRVENRRAYIVNAPTLLTVVAGKDLESSEHVDIRSKVSEIRVALADALRAVGTAIVEKQCART